MKKCIFFLSLLIFFKSEAQRAVPRDTSFTIHATYEKEKKKRPYIQIAAPVMPKTVQTEKDLIFYRDADRALLLDIFYPKKRKGNSPAVLLIFGGGWRSGDKSQNHAIAIRLAEMGYVAVSAEYRLSPEAAYPAAVIDLKNALRWMRANSKKYQIATDKIAVLGCSAGAQLASLLGSTNKTTRLGGVEIDTTNASVQAVINIDGILAFHHPESAEGAVAAQWLGGTYEQVPKVWEEASALNHVDSSSVPVLFLNSSLPRFHAGRSDMIQKMSALNIYTEVHEFPDTPHPFWFFHPWFEPMMERVKVFLGRVMK